MSDVLYSAYHLRTGGYHIDHFGEFQSGGPYYDQITFSEFEVIKETPKGYWVEIDYETKKWVAKTSKNSKKRFAYPTKEEALNGFIKRTERYIEILESRLEKAKAGLDVANRIKEDQSRE